MDSRNWFAYMFLSIFAAQMLINAAALSIAIYIMLTLKTHLKWVKGYLGVTKAYADLVESHKSEVASRVEEKLTVLAQDTQRKVETKGAEIKEEIRKAVDDLKH